MSCLSQCATREFVPGPKGDNNLRKVIPRIRSRSSLMVTHYAHPLLLTIRYYLGIYGRKVWQIFPLKLVFRRSTNVPVPLKKGGLFLPEAMSGRVRVWRLPEFLSYIVGG